MAINLELVRSKLKELQKSESKNNLLWKPSPGDNDIRILPYKYRPENPFLELFFYYPAKPNKPSIFKKTVVSPISFGNPDPVVEFCNELMATGDKDEWVTGKKLSPSRRTFLPIIVRGKEKEGVKFWGFPDTVFQKLALLMEDAAPEDITDFRTGRDVTVNLVKASGENSYDKTDVRLKLKQSVATEDKEVIELIKNMPQINDMYVEPTYDSLKRDLDIWLKTSSEDTAEPTSEDNTKSKIHGDDILNSDASSTEIVDHVLSDVEAEFDNLFNEA